MDHGWGINGREQLLEKGRVEDSPSHADQILRVRVIREDDEDCLEVKVPEALEKVAGWRFNEHGTLLAVC